MLQEAINTAVQLAVVLIIAGIVWLIWGRKAGGFARFIGLIAPTPRAMLWALVATLVLIPATIGLFLTPALHDVATGPNTVIGAFRARGLSAETAGLIVLVAFVKTALTEEILFRGVIAKRLIAWLGFQAGNLIQAMLFGSVHMLVFAGPHGAPFEAGLAATFFAVTASGGWVMGFLNERFGNGSIAPSWLLHGLANAVAYPALAFFL